DACLSGCACVTIDAIYLFADSLGDGVRYDRVRPASGRMVGGRHGGHCVVGNPARAAREATRHHRMIGYNQSLTATLAVTRNDPSVKTHSRARRNDHEDAHACRL